jgi:hypothetical protein
MGWSESEILTVLLLAAAGNAAGLVAWRRRAVGHWYAVAIVVSTLALLLPTDISEAVPVSAVALLALGAVGVLAFLRQRGVTRTSSRHAGSGRPAS